MTRTIPAAIATALQQKVVQPFFAVEMLFDSGSLRIWSGIGNRTIAGNSYTGAGNLISLESIEESADLSAKTANMKISGLESAIIAYALGEPYQNRTARIYFGCVDVASVEVEIFSGFMNTMEIEDGGETANIKLSIDSKMIELEKISGLRYTQQSLQSQYAGDTFFNWTTGLADREIVWGRK